MPVKSLPQDKPKIAFHAAMMAIENFGFFMMYYDIWGFTPGPQTAGGVVTDPCESTRAAVSFFALTCFCVAFLCVGMGYGGYTDDDFVFPLYFLLHLVGGACYTVGTITVPLARWSDDGKTCATLNWANGERLAVVYYLHASLYLVYVGSMLSILYFSYLKPTFFSDGADVEASAQAGVLEVKAAGSTE